MADDIKPRLRVPTTAKKGEVIEVKTLITHPMENGQRKDAAGNVIPRQIGCGPIEPANQSLKSPHRCQRAAITPYSTQR